ALLEAPNRGLRQGQRDYTLLLFLYNSGARVSEAASLRIADLILRPKGLSEVRLSGKGGKVRRCPLWSSTSQELLVLTQQRSPDHPVFVNRFGQAITRHGIHRLLRVFAKKAGIRCPSLLRKRVSPHTIRHTTATHLLRAGVDINTIRAWLGHVSIDTTNIYAEVDLERKAKALSQCTFKAARPPRKHWKDNPSLLKFLQSL
ncbi:MAG TPA: tyrosine-type recombinase/integrase, partial [Nitrososphaera sp.]|nr:tyrosine-type recombinase/integrase [Nitrososphaera sp.]